MSCSKLVRVLRLHYQSSQSCQRPKESLNLNNINSPFPFSISFVYLPSGWVVYCGLASFPSSPVIPKRVVHAFSPLSISDSYIVVAWQCLVHCLPLVNIKKYIGAAGDTVGAVQLNEVVLVASKLRATFIKNLWWSLSPVIKSNHWEANLARNIYVFFWKYYRF